jgi:hypothetical protein
MAKFLFRFGIQTSCFFFEQKEYQLIKMLMYDLHLPLFGWSETVFEAIGISKWRKRYYLEMRNNIVFELLIIVNKNMRYKIFTLKIVDRSIKIVVEYIAYIICVRKSWLKHGRHDIVC